MRLNFYRIKMTNTFSVGRILSKLSDWRNLHQRILGADVQPITHAMGSTRFTLPQTVINKCVILRIFIYLPV